MIKKTNLKNGIQTNNKIIDGKSLIISGEIHAQMKEYTKINNLRISFLVEKLFLDHINKEKANLNQKHEEIK